MPVSQRFEEIFLSIGDRILFEDDQIRIWEMCLKPGEHSETHFHGSPYSIVVVSGDHVTVDCLANLEGLPADGYGAAKVKQGDSFYLCAGSTEVAKNTGTKTYRDIQVEFKQDLATQEFKLSNR